MMKKKKILYFVIFVFIILLSYFSIRNNEVTVYLGVANGSIDSMKVQLTIDEKNIFSDDLINNPFKYNILKVEMKSGFHNIEILSDNGSVHAKKRLFVLLNQHIVVEYYEDCAYSNKPCFEIRNMITPFYLE